MYSFLCVFCFRPCPMPAHVRALAVFHSTKIAMKTQSTQLRRLFLGLINCFQRVLPSVYGKERMCGHNKQKGGNAFPCCRDSIAAAIVCRSRRGGADVFAPHAQLAVWLSRLLHEHSVGCAVRILHDVDALDRSRQLCAVGSVACNNLCVL